MSTKLGIGIGIQYMRGAGFCPEFQAVYDSWVNKPSSTVAYNMNRWVRNKKYNGSWDLADRVYNMAVHTNANDEALIDWKDPTNVGKKLILHGTLTFTAYEGFQGDGTSGYLEVPYNPTIDGVNYQLNSASIRLYNRGGETIGNEVIVGVEDGSNYTYVQLHKVTTNETWLRFQSNNAITIFVPSNYNGPLTFLRHNYSQEIFIRNERAVEFLASSGLVNYNIPLLAINLDGTISNYSTAQLSIFEIGKDLRHEIIKSCNEIDERYMDFNGKGVVSSWGDYYQDAPARRYGVNMEQSLYANKIYVCNGMTDNSTFHGDMYVYDITSNSWSTKSANSYPADGVCSWFYNGKVYVFGGRNVIGSPVGLNYTRIYDIVSDTWSLGASIPTPVADARACGYDDGGTYKIYVIGGYGVGGSTDYVDKAQLYYPDTDTWETISPPANLLSGEAAGPAIYYNNCIYVFGGTNSNMAKVEKYDIATDTWSYLTDLPTELQSSNGYGLLAVLDTTNNLIHLINGETGYHATWNPVDQSIVAKASTLSIRKWTNLTYANGKIYYSLGGGASNLGESDLLEVYDIATDTWSR